MDLHRDLLCSESRQRGGWGRSPSHYRFQKVFGATATDLPEFLKSVDGHIATLSDHSDMVNREIISLENVLLVEH